MQRKTFEETVRTILANTKLGEIVQDDIPATESNWQEAALEAQSQANSSIQSLCADLRMVTGIPIYPFANFKTIVWQGVGPVEVKAQWTWEQFITQYPRFINSTIKNIACNNKNDVTYPIHPLVWHKTEAYTIFPNSKGSVESLKLRKPEEYTGEIPAHFKRKLDLLKRTNYEYQPYILKDRAGHGMILVIKLGDQWKDIVIASHDQPSNLGATVLSWIMLAFFLLISWNAGKFAFSGEEVHWAVSALLGTITLISLTLSVLISCYLVCKKFGTMRI